MNNKCLQFFLVRASGACWQNTLSGTLQRGYGTSTPRENDFSQSNLVTEAKCLQAVGNNPTHTQFTRQQDHQGVI